NMRVLSGSIEVGRNAAVRPRYPATAADHPAPAGPILKRLQQLDSDLAVAGAAVEQEAVFGVETALQVHAAVGRVRKFFKLGGRQGPKLGAGFLAFQHVALLLAALQLPEAQPDQYR